MTPRAGALALTLALAAGCDDPTPPRLAEPDAAVRVDASDVGADGGPLADVGPERPALPMYEVLRLDARRNEFPEGVAARQGSGYVSIPGLGRVIEVSPDGASRAYATVPTNVTAHGLAFDAMGRLLLVAVSPTAGESGLWRAAAGGGPAAFIAGDAQYQGPGAVAVDASGGVWLTDSPRGAIWKLAPDGRSLARWSSDALLAGGAVVCGPAQSVRTGANALVVDLTGSAVYVTNTDHAAVVRVAIAADGSAGPATTFTARDCPRLAGAWGLAAGPGGALLVAAGGVDALTRVAPGGALTAVDAPAGLLRSPAGVAFDAEGGVLWVASSAWADAVRPGATPLPGVARVPVR